MKDELVVIRKPTGRRVELRLDGQPVSWTELLYRRLRIGRARLTFGGLGGVGTRREHRMKGYSRRVLDHCIEVMTADGLDLSMLFGIPDYYDKFGFRTALSDYEFTVAGRDLIGLKPALKTRRLRPAEHPAILPLYRRDLPRRALGTERGNRPPLRVTSRRGGYVAVEPIGAYRNGRLAGYMVADSAPNAVCVSELVAPSRDALVSLLACLGRQCRDRIVERATFFLPPSHPVGVMAVDLGCKFTRDAPRTGHGMMRILNLEHTLAALQGELTARWQASPLGARPLELTLQTDMGRGELRLPGTGRSQPPLRGRVRVEQSRLTQLITGYVGAADMAERPSVRIPRKLVAPLAVLFPARDAYIVATNRF